jgi:hypothetical protein
MKTIQLFVVTLLMAIIPMFFISCGEKGGVGQPGVEEPGGDIEEDASILGEWECVNAVLKHDNDPSAGEDSSEKGQVWVFGEDELTIDGKSYTYKLSGSKLTTEYADELYNSSYFTVDGLTKKNLTLSVSYLDETKVGNTTITVIMYFDRITK